MLSIELSKVHNNDISIIRINNAHYSAPAESIRYNISNAIFGYIWKWENCKPEYIWNSSTDNVIHTTRFLSILVMIGMDIEL